jgi:hypothetical protein
VDIGSREENAINEESRAFSSEVDSGSREENAINEESRAADLMQSGRVPLKIAASGKKTGMQGILYEESSVWLFLLVTVAMGGWAAWRTGKALAKLWRPSWMLIPYMMLLGGAVRFIHFAMFEGTLFSLRYYLVDTLVILIAAWLGWRHERTAAMARQYAFAFEKATSLTWRRKGA